LEVSGALEEELGGVKGANVWTGAFGAIAGAIVNGEPVSLLTGDTVGLAVVDPSGEAVTIGTVGRTTGTATGTVIGAMIGLAVVDPSGAAVTTGAVGTTTGTVGGVTVGTTTEGVSTGVGTVFGAIVPGETAMGAKVLNKTEGASVGDTVTVGCAVKVGPLDGLVERVGAKLEVGVPVTFGPIDGALVVAPGVVGAGNSVSKTTGGAVIEVGAIVGASEKNAVQFPASKNGMHSNAQSVLFTSKHPLPTISMTNRSPSSPHTELT